MNILNIVYKITSVISSVFMSVSIKGHKKIKSVYRYKQQSEKMKAITFSTN